MDIVESINRKKKLKLIDRLKAKFGAQFLEDMTRLHRQRGFTLTMMSGRYGVTRQRISQIHINLFGTHLLETPRESDIPLGCEYDPRQRLLMAKEGHFHNNLLARKIFFERAIKFGLKIKANGKGFLFDTPKGSKSIIVRTCQRPKKYANCSSIKYMRYSLPPVFDFVAGMHPDQTNFTIVPRKEINDRKCIYVPLEKSPNKNAKNPYEKFFEAWLLLTL